MANWLDEAIHQAEQDGLFDNLPFRGKPLNLSQDAYEDPDWRIAHRILKQSGETLPWIAHRKALVADIDQARQKLQRAWQWYDHHEASPGWRRAVNDFETAVKLLNKRIRDFNLTAPATSVHLFSLVVERELQRIKAG